MPRSVVLLISTSPHCDAGVHPMQRRHKAFPDSLRLPTRPDSGLPGSVCLTAAVPWRLQKELDKLNKKMAASQARMKKKHKKKSKQEKKKQKKEKRKEKREQKKEKKKAKKEQKKAKKGKKKAKKGKDEL